MTEKEDQVIHGLRHECVMILDQLKETEEILVDLVGHRPMTEKGEDEEPECRLDALDNALKAIRAQARYNNTLVHDVGVRL